MTDRDPSFRVRRWPCFRHPRLFRRDHAPSSPSRRADHTDRLKSSQESGLPHTVVESRHWQLWKRGCLVPRMAVMPDQNACASPRFCNGCPGANMREVWALGVRDTMRKYDIMRKGLLAVILGFIALLTGLARADNGAAENDDSRFTFHRAADGFVRLDGRSG